MGEKYVDREEENGDGCDCIRCLRIELLITRIRRLLWHYKTATLHKCVCKQDNLPFRNINQ